MRRLLTAISARPGPSDTALSLQWDGGRSSAVTTATSNGGRSFAYPDRMVDIDAAAFGRVQTMSAIRTSTRSSRSCSSQRAGCRWVDWDTRLTKLRAGCNLRGPPSFASPANDSKLQVDKCSWRHYF